MANVIMHCKYFCKLSHSEMGMDGAGEPAGEGIEKWFSIYRAWLVSFDI